MWILFVQPLGKSIKAGPSRAQAAQRYRNLAANALQLRRELDDRSHAVRFADPKQPPAPPIAAPPPARREPLQRMRATSRSRRPRLPRVAGIRLSDHLDG